MTDTLWLVLILIIGLSIIFVPAVLLQRRANQRWAALPPEERRLKWYSNPMKVAAILMALSVIPIALATLDDVLDARTILVTVGALAYVIATVVGLWKEKLWAVGLFFIVVVIPTVLGVTTGDWIMVVAGISSFIMWLGVMLQYWQRNAIS